MVGGVCGIELRLLEWWLGVAVGKHRVAEPRGLQDILVVLTAAVVARCGGVVSFFRWCWWDAVMRLRMRVAAMVAG